MDKLQADILLLIQSKNSMKQYYSMDQICNRLGITKERLLVELRKISDAGTPITVEDGEILRFNWPERIRTPYNMDMDKDHVRLALLGDTHMASKYTDLDSLDRAYDLIEKKQVDAVLHSGDLVDGIVSSPNYDIRQELIEPTYKGQVEYVIDRYPKYSGKTFIISGNHDDYWTRLTGKEPIKDVADKRDDMVYLGASKRVVLINGLRVNVLHGRFPKHSTEDIYTYIDDIPTRYKPDIVHAGHYHTGKHSIYDGVEVFRSGSFMKAKPREVEKGQRSDNSTYFVDVYYDDDGNVAEITHEKKTFRR